MTIYVGFVFFNELEILDLHLKELYDHVDGFILVEATTTFQGAEKKLYYNENKHLFSVYADKIKHIIVDDITETDDPWIREKFQRSCIKRGLTDVPPDSRVVITDVDEIVRPEVMGELRRRTDFCLLGMDRYVFHLNWYAGPWFKTFCASLPYIMAMEDFDIARHEEIFYLARNQMSLEHVIHDAGWHFSWMGGEERIIAKAKAYSHTEANTEPYHELHSIRKFLADKYVPSFDIHLVPVTIDESFPVSIQKAEAFYLEKGFIEKDPAESPRDTIKYSQEVILKQRQKNLLLNREMIRPIMEVQADRRKLHLVRDELAAECERIRQERDALARKIRSMEQGSTWFSRIFRGWSY